MFKRRTEQIMRLAHQQDEDNGQRETLPIVDNSSAHQQGVEDRGQRGTLPIVDKSSAHQQGVEDNGQRGTLPVVDNDLAHPQDGHKGDNIPINAAQEPAANALMELCPITGEFIPMHVNEAEMVLCPISGNLIPAESSIAEELTTINQHVEEMEINIQENGAEKVLCPITGNFILGESSYNIEVEIISEEDDEVSVTKRKKLHQKRRTIGKTYMGYQKVNGVYRQCSVKGQKKMKQRCNHQQPKKLTGNSLSCFAVNEDDRSITFNKFWSLATWAEKKAYVQGMVIARQVKRRRSNTNKENALKKRGYDFYLATQDGKKHKVCLKMFTHTVNITQSMLSRWCTSQTIQEADSTQNKKDNKKTKVSQDMRNNIKTWLDLVPKVPSHYCRKDSSRVYVENSFLSKSHMLSIYNAWCDESNLPKVGRNVFSEVLKAENISIHQPRKDQCDLCTAYKLNNINKDVYEEHMKRKEQAREAKLCAKNSASDTTLVLTMDLQSVLLCPKLMASAVYYKQKLQVHNFTIYVLNNADVTMYTWHEADGGVTANEFTTCIVDYLNGISPSYKKVILISDGCNYQNRNKVLASALSDLSKFKNIEIQQIFLEKGHTMMEADNIHSVLEHYFKPPIYAPSDYVMKMKMARPKHPYDVRNVHFDFFLNYEAISSNLSSLRPGRNDKSSPKVTDLRGLQYLPNHIINYKIDHDLDWQQLPQRRMVSRYSSPQRLYLSSIAIARSKYNHLQELKMYIDKDYHPFYNDLKFD